VPACVAHPKQAISQRAHFALELNSGGVDNFASLLIVCCGQYLALQLSGGIPRDLAIPIASMNADRVLAIQLALAP